jgi:hypothetical protein
MLRLPLQVTKLKAESRNFLYFAAVTASMELAKLEGPYSTFEGSQSRENFSIICGTLKMKIYQAVGTGQH